MADNNKTPKYTEKTIAARIRGAAEKLNEYLDMADGKSMDVEIDLVPTDSDAVRLSIGNIRKQISEEY